MGRAPCCSGDHSGLKKGPWSQEEDMKLKSFLLNHPTTSWRLVPLRAGLVRCGKSCRLRWMNYLRPDIRRGNFTAEEEAMIFQLHEAVGNKWSIIAAHLPGRTDNEIKNLWNTKLRKVLVLKGINPSTHQPLCNLQLAKQIMNWVRSIQTAILARQASMSTTTNNNNNGSSSSESVNADILSFNLPNSSLATPPSECRLNPPMSPLPPLDGFAELSMLSESLFDQRGSQASEVSFNDAAFGDDVLLPTDHLRSEFGESSTSEAIMPLSDVNTLQPSAAEGFGFWDC